MNSMHASIDSPRLFECEGDVVVQEWDKVGCFSLTPIKELDLPEWYTNDNTHLRVLQLIAIRCLAAVLPVWYDIRPTDESAHVALEAIQAVYVKDTKETRLAARTAVDEIPVVKSGYDEPFDYSVYRIVRHVFAMVTNGYSKGDSTGYILTKSMVLRPDLDIVQLITTAIQEVMNEHQ
jgi:hypothetical protein